MEILPGVSVDCFDRDAEVYLLSHFHEDHMRGLEKGWSRGPLYASEVTCRLVQRLRRVPKELLRPVRPGHELEAGRITIAALPANHCPGSVMFRLSVGAGRQSSSALYTGDFRLDDEVRASLRDAGEVDTLYIDSTYADPKYRFPSQGEAVERVVELVTEAGDGNEVMLAVYTIGKNRIVEAVARAAGRRVYLPDATRRVYELLGLGEFVTRDRDSTHLRGYARGFFEEYFFSLPRARREGATVVIPTGWAEDMPTRPVRRGGATFHYVPYSEHCDWAERQEALRLVRAKRVVDI